MTVLDSPPPPADALVKPRTGVEFLRELGDVPLARVLFDPPPGTVTLEHYERIDGRVNGRLVELINKTLVEKAMGWNEGRIAMLLGARLVAWVEERGLGDINGADGMVRMTGRNVRMPDVAFYDKRDYEAGQRPTEPVPTVPPRLTVEVLSDGNTPREIALKLAEYFASGTRLAYVINPTTRTARRHTSAEDFTEVPTDSDLDGGDVLPGWRTPLAGLFA